MSETKDNITALEPSRKLLEAVRAAKNAAADRGDVVVEMRDAEKVRLELLVGELAPIISDIPAENETFDFAMSSGLQPRFWIDAVAHVAMGRDKRSYRFVKDTRNGRVVLAETPDIRAAADAVTRYVAERMVEREHAIDGGMPIGFRARTDVEGGGDKEDAVASSSLAHTPSNPEIASPETQSYNSPSGWSLFLWSLAIFLFGAIFGYSTIAIQIWNNLRAATGL